MKANQAFKQADEAVSPVIGVILMVAITVVLAAVVFVLVGNLTDTSEAAPSVSFIKSENGTAPGGTLTVQSIQNGPVTNVTLGGTSHDAAACTISAGAAISSSNPLSAGDTITCTAAGTITVSDGTNLLYNGEFS